LASICEALPGWNVTCNKTFANPCNTNAYTCYNFTATANFTCLCLLTVGGAWRNYGYAGEHSACCVPNSFGNYLINNPNNPGPGDNFCITKNNNDASFYCDSDPSSPFFHTCANDLLPARIVGVTVDGTPMMPIPASVALIFAAFFLGIILSYGIYKVAKMRKSYISGAPQPLKDDSQRSLEMEESSSPTESLKLTNQV